MPSWVVPSDSHVVSDTGHTTDHNHMADDLTLINSALPVVSGGLTGALQAVRLAGATTSGAPVSGTFAVGDFIIDQTGKVWVCTAAGTPGTWVNAGSSSGVSSFNSRTGAVSPTSGDYTAAQVTNAADKSSGSAQNFTGNVQAPAHVAAGLTGATAASRYVGATASGAPASGTFAVGDFTVDQSGTMWVCTSAGTPGTWVALVNATAAQTVTGVKMFEYPGNSSATYSDSGCLVVSSDGTATSGGAIVLNPASESHGFISIYSSTLGIPAFFVPDIVTTHWAPAFGAITAQGFGIVGSTSGSGDVCFGVLNFSQVGGPGLGSGTFTCLDNNTVVTFNNTLDNGSGAAIFTGVVQLKAGTDTSNTATASSPAFTSGTAKQLSTTQDVMLYIAVQTSAALSVAIGPTSTPANTVMPSKSYALSLNTLRIPKGWWVTITGTIADLTITQVTC